jgi:hypothetical protein
MSSHLHVYIGDLQVIQVSFETANRRLARRILARVCTAPRASENMVGSLEHDSGAESARKSPNSSRHRPRHDLAATKVGQLFSRSSREPSARVKY